MVKDGFESVSHALNGDGEFRFKVGPLLRGPSGAQVEGGTGFGGKIVGRSGRKGSDATAVAENLHVRG